MKTTVWIEKALGITKLAGAITKIPSIAPVIGAGIKGMAISGGAYGAIESLVEGRGVKDTLKTIGLYTALGPLAKAAPYVGKLLGKGLYLPPWLVSKVGGGIEALSSGAKLTATGALKGGAAVNKAMRPIKEIVNFALDSKLVQKGVEKLSPGSRKYLAGAADIGGWSAKKIAGKSKGMLEGIKWVGEKGEKLGMGIQRWAGGSLYAAADILNTVGRGKMPAFIDIIKKPVCAGF